MADIEIASDALQCIVSTQGGAIWKLWAVENGNRIHPLLRQPVSGKGRDASRSGCFPLVPFGNRVEHNRFAFGGKAYRLGANTPGDPHYVHGDGWLHEWAPIEAEPNSTRLIFDHNSQIYSYHAEQCFRVDGRVLEATLSVTNTGDEPMPFGLGWHPFFPLTREATLLAPSETFWTEKAGWLPGERRRLPAELDFRAPRSLPLHWINNGFEGWDGRAEIRWPDRELQLEIATKPALSRYFLFVSDSGFDPGYRNDFFCFEPMTHSANGHNLPDLGGLSILAAGEAMSVTMRLSWSHMSRRS